jgi:hypothetical protein
MQAEQAIVPPTDIVLNHDQQAAYDRVRDWVKSFPAPADQRAQALCGAAGTGKTLLVGEILKFLRSERVGVKLTAATGKAAQRLAELAKASVRTLHSTLYEPPSDEASGGGRTSNRLVFESLQASPGGLLVVDEASMITPSVWRDLNVWMSQGTHVLLVGDGFQLPPILSPAEAKEYPTGFVVFDQVPSPMILGHVVRTRNEILQIATILRTEGRLPRESLGAYQFVRSPVGQAVHDYVTEPDDHVVVTWRNELRMKLARAIRTKTVGAGVDHRMPQPGERIVFRRNGQGVVNGQTATVNEVVEERSFGSVMAHLVRVDEVRRDIRVFIGGRKEPMDGEMPWLEGDAFRTYVSALNTEAKEGNDRRPRRDPIPVTWACALTGHLVQGSQYRRVTVALTEGDTYNKAFNQPTRLPDGKRIPFALRWIYTALTRAVDSATLIVGVER